MNWFCVTASFPKTAVVLLVVDVDGWVARGLIFDIIPS